jgi:hypothetical protein
MMGLLVSNEFDTARAVKQLIANTFTGRYAAQGILLSKQIDQPFSRSEAARFILDSVGELLTAYENERLAKKNPNATGLWPRIDDADFKQDIIGIAKRYIDLPDLHAPGMTRLLACAVMDTELYPLAREMEDPAMAMARVGGPKVALAMFSQTTFGRISGWIVSVVILGIAAVSWFLGLSWLAIALAVFLAWGISREIISGRKIRAVIFKGGLKLRALHQMLGLIRTEIASGSVNTPVIKERLRTSEREGAYVPSILYSLLELPRQH